ncbi:MAG: cell wall hydrolase [Thioclava marina]|jgi:Cell wall hydrolyses involved in spore germination|uniref:Cell wall hydrolase n=1 Tax=Thioclava marina TaxID=1915077 RepID=A0ABX3MJC9_9RHOB|nr:MULTISPECIES: cell wall hydrolase [Thioclava]TNE82954.1 MAG: cell wall hydrolase [Paracoccaceae bacterium]MBC7144666.1 cell wall hydrolase [Thioclava marina]MBD3804450.1 cell wall hydrolase [Thioclava sp.]OOY11623.1 cell wall hydrolase [Thioclava marina]OOY27452.1 cell wall hydrolase [Thioclava sp. L04-15]
MSVLKSWTGGAIVLLALAGGLRAEVTVSQSNDPGEVAEQGLMSVLWQERSAMSAIDKRRVTALTMAPARSKNVASQKNLPPVLSADWLAKQPAATGDAQFQCLSKALYFEARGEGVKGQQAVAEVILNRVDDPRFPGSICGVVHQSNRRGCQFSWYCDGKADRVNNSAAYAKVAKVARAMIDGAPRSLTVGATYFHTRTIRPSWSRRFDKTASIGHHVFYADPIRTAEN